MSDKSIPLIVTVVILALMFAWVQLLNFAFPRWRRSIKRRLLKRMYLQRAKRRPNHRVSSRQSNPDHAPLSSHRLKNQSRDLLQALSAIGDRAVPRTQPTTQRIPPDLE
jgi:hypothetical protein